MTCKHCRSNQHTLGACPTRWAERVAAYGRRGQKLRTEEVNELYRASKRVFRYTLRSANFDERGTTALLTKFNDAGPRSAPTAAFSSVVPGRPQSGADGNRINRWLLPEGHKQYATEREARLVGTRFILQALSMQDAPEVPGNALRDDFMWLTGHIIEPGQYDDPVMKIPINFVEMFKDPRIVTSGHIVPLSHDGGFHTIENTFLQLKKSNDLQGDNTVDELLEMMQGILMRHGKI